MEFAGFYKIKLSEENEQRYSTGVPVCSYILLDQDNNILLESVGENKIEGSEMGGSD